MSPEEARRILQSAELICTEAQVQAAVQRVAVALNAHLQDANPLVLAVMGGATIFAGHLLPQLRSKHYRDRNRTARRRYRWQRSTHQTA